MTNYLLRGVSLVGGAYGETGGASFHGVNPASGETLAPAYHSASAAEAGHGGFDCGLRIADCALFENRCVKRCAAQGEVIEGDVEKWLPGFKVCLQAFRTTFNYQTNERSIVLNVLYARSSKHRSPSPLFSFS